MTSSSIANQCDNYPLKIRIITNGYPDDKWRVKSIFTHELCAALVHNGADVEVLDLESPVTFGKEVSCETFEGISVTRLNLSKKKNNFYEKIYKHYMKWVLINKGKDDCVDVYSFLDFNIIIGCFFTRKKNKQIFLISHGADAYKVHYSRIKFIFKKALEKCGKIFAVSDYTATILRTSNLKLHEGIVEVIPNGINISKFDVASQLTKEDARSRINVGKGFYLLCVCDLVYRKGIDLIIDSLSKLDKNINAKLIIIGRGPEHHSLLMSIKNKELGEMVEFIDYIDSDERLALYYRACDVYIMMSRDVAYPLGTEGFGISYAEAAYMGLPVIAGRSGGVPLPVVNNMTGYLVDPYSKTCSEQVAYYISVLYKNEIEYKRMSSLGVEYVKRNFSWNNSAMQMIKSIREINIPI